MVILSGKEIREADKYTIANEPIESIDLMERAASACFEWIARNASDDASFKIFCGTGNNGGDGLALARLLNEEEYEVEVFIIRYSSKSSADFSINLEILKNQPLKINEIISGSDLPSLDGDDVIIDAMFGTGLSKNIEGIAAEVIHHINESRHSIISIDMPSGLFSDAHSNGAIIKAAYTLTFQFPKLAFLFAENAEYVGQWIVLEIGLISNHVHQHCKLLLTHVNHLLQQRNKFSHKGMYGHAMVIAGSYGKTGAALLATKACVKSGAGLTTALVPKSSYSVMQTAVPEAMCMVDDGDYYLSQELSAEKLSGYTAIGIGPGIGVENSVKKMLKSIMHFQKPMVVDADALNILSQDPKLIGMLPANSILTPHPKEFARLAGEAANDFDRHEMQINFSKRHKVFIVLKGAYTCITTPDGDAIFNSTGNASMAKGGSGDVLTGILTALLAQGYVPRVAAEIGVFIHGAAGDIALEKKSPESVTATDIIESLPEAFARARGGHTEDV